MKSCGFNFKTSYTNLPEGFYTRCTPEPVKTPKCVIINWALASSLGLKLNEVSKKDLAGLFSGKRLPYGATPIALAYAGHQFGHFTLLGDGRAHMLGEHITPDQTRLDIQFKGSGRTPYSRRGDGKAALGPMLREYVISEAMHFLKIPTTRSLAVVATGEPVMREEILQGAILTRVARSHIRIGTFEYAATQLHQRDLNALLNYTITRHYPELCENPNKPLALLQSVMEKHISLIVEWMRVGFIHGVMNTDNMSLSGETIDYGPCAFMENYDPTTVFSSIDREGRYAFGNQAIIAHWNLAQLAATLLPLIDENMEKAVDLAEATLNGFSDLYAQKWLLMMRSKLGLSDQDPDDELLIQDLLAWMKDHQADYTNTFCDLMQEAKPIGEIYHEKPFQEWYGRWKKRLERIGKPRSDSIDLMQKTNPRIIPRNHKVEQSLKAAEEGDLVPLRDLLKALENPYQDDPSHAPYQSPAAPHERIFRTFCGT